MANEIVFRRAPSINYAVTIRDIGDSFKIWKVAATAAFEAFGTGARTLSDYGVNSSEAFGNGMHAANMPAGISSAYRLLIEIYIRAGADLADDDVFDGSFIMVWNGSSQEFEIDTSGRVDVGAVLGTAQTANDNGADINLILGDTNEMQGKLPANKFMGSSDGADDDGNVASILTTVSHGTYGNSALKDHLTVIQSRLLAFVQLITRSDSAIYGDKNVEMSLINANEGSGAGDYDSRTESIEAIRDRGDSYWDTDSGVTVAYMNNDVIRDRSITVEALSLIWAEAMVDLAAEVPSDTCSVLVAINYLYEAWRNKRTQTGTEIAIYKNNNTTVLVEADISDDGSTFTKEKFGAED